MLRFWGNHLLLLNLTLCALVWLLYGSLMLYGFGHEYAARARDFWLEDSPELFRQAPGIENVLLPGLAAIVRWAWTGIGLPFTDTTFVIVAAVPYVLFAYGFTRHVRANAGRAMAVAAALAVYTSGMVPYMTGWGGYVDGLSYLLLLPVFVRPESLLVYAVTFVLQCLNHYLGAVALVVFAFAWHAMRPGGLRAFALRALVSGVIIGAFLWFWDALYPLESAVRQRVLAEKWQNPRALVDEVFGLFPVTMLSAFKLTAVPLVAFMLARGPRRTGRALTVAAPFVAASLLTMLFVDVTRVMTLLTMPVLAVTIDALRRGSALPPPPRRRIRRLLLATAALNVLLPNFYINNGRLEL